MEGPGGEQQREAGELAAKPLHLGGLQSLGVLMTTPKELRTISVIRARTSRTLSWLLTSDWKRSCWDLFFLDVQTGSINSMKMTMKVST